MSAMNRRTFAAGAALVLAAWGARPSLAQNVTFTIDPTKSNQSISPYIYGANATLSSTAYKNLNLTSERQGGNRWTAYNWTNNASNAGSDFNYQNDGLLSSSTTPGAAVAPFLTDSTSRNALGIVTVPINGYVAADRSGPQPKNGNPATNPHFAPEFPTQAADPSPAAGHVYQDGFVNWVKTNYPAGLTANSSAPIAFMLDNEPDLWSSTHSEVHPTPVTYAELIQKSTDYAKAIKGAAPNAMVYGPASYGWQGFQNLQNAPDSGTLNAATNPNTGKAYGDFLSYYLAQMKAASTTAGTRLIDALDVHWYPEAQGNNASGTPTRITGTDTSPGVAAARMHAARSLWDPTYVESSWITQDSTGGKAIQLIPRLTGEINANYAGTKLSISEYNYGGGQDISGGVAEADVLGTFGKYGVYSAQEWPLASNESFILGAFRMFRNYDGHSGSFGDTSISATSTGNTADTSIYAASDSAHPGRLTLVAINESTGALAAKIALQNAAATYSSFDVYQLTSGSALSSDGTSILPTFVGTFPISALWSYTMPAESVSTIVLTPTPEPAACLGVISLAFVALRRRR